MTIRRIRTTRFIANILPLAVCLCLNGGEACAQTSSENALQIDPPAVPRYRRTRPAFQVEADPASKPLPIPEFRTSDPVVPLTRSQMPPTKEDIAKEEALRRDKQRKQAEQDRRQEHLITMGKVLGFLGIVGIGIFALTDIARQVRKAKQASQLPAPEEDYLDDNPMS